MHVGSVGPGVQCEKRTARHSSQVCMMDVAYHGVSDNVDMQILQHLPCCLHLTWRHAFQDVPSCIHIITVT